MKLGRTAGAPACRCWVLLLGSMVCLSACTGDPTWNGTTKIEYSQTDYERFLDEANRDIAADPTGDRGYAERGYAYDGLGQYETAIADIDKAIEINDRESLYFGERGYAYYKLRNYERAIEDSTMALSLDPKNVSAYINRALARIDRSHCDSFSRDIADCQAAIADYRVIVKLVPNSASARRTLNNLGG